MTLVKTEGLEINGVSMIFSAWPLTQQLAAAARIPVIRLVHFRNPIATLALHPPLAPTASLAKYVLERRSDVHNAQNV